MNFRHLLIMSLMLFAGINVAVSQTTFTQTESGVFQKGTGQDVAVVDGSVAVRSKMISMIDWEATTNLPAVRRNHQMVTWRDFVFCIGGSTNGTSSVNTVYSAQSTTSGLSSWTTLNAMPVYLRDMAAVATQTRLIVAGGRNSNGVSDKIYVATISSGTSIGSWTESSFTLPQPLWGARAISVLDYIYIIGGATTDSPDDASNKVYCIKLNAIGDIASISEVANLPEARNGHDVTTYDSKIYVTGGYDASHTLKSTVYCATVNLNGTLGAWQTQTPLPVAIANHTSLCTHGIIGVMGGFDGELQTNRFYSANPDDAQLSWNMSSTMLFERNQDGDAFVINDKMYFAGGLNLQGVVTNYVRYATILTGSEKVKKASFISSPFDIGSEKTIQDMAYTLTYAQETASYEMLYRVADNDMLFGDWISAGTANPVTLNLSKSHLQYMFRMTSTADDDMQINDFSITMPGFTQLSGNLNNMAVLSLDASPYWVTGDIAFTSGSHVIEAGVTMYFALNTGLTIGKASVNFNGTEELPITLTFQGDDEAKWKGVYFQDDSDNTVRSSMTYTNITNAGYGDYNANLYLNKTSQPSMSNCVFDNAEGHGLHLVESSPSIVSCSFSGNSESGIYLNNSAPSCVDCSMSGNAYGISYGTTNFNASFNSVTVTGNDVGLYSCSPNRNFIFNPEEISISGNVADIAVAGGQITADHTWNAVSSCYKILGDIQIYNSSTQPKLTLQPGCMLKFAEGKYLDVAYYYNSSSSYSNYGGKLYAVGTTTDSIVFTALNGQPGGWGGIRFNNGSDYNSASSMRYCVVEKAVNNVYSYYTTQPTIQFSTLKEASSNCVSLNNADITIEESTLCNSTRGLYLSSSSPLLVQVTFDNMSHSCVYHATVSNHVLYHSCIMRNSFAGVRFFGPDTDIPAHPEVAFSGNGTEVYVAGGNIYNDSRIWGKNNYLVGGNIGISSSNSNTPRLLTIGEGSVVKFASGTRMYVGCYLNSDGTVSTYYYYGRLNAVGSAEDPVVFTSESGEPGGWNGLYFSPYCNADYPSLLKHCIVENGTYNLLTYNSMPTIEDCLIRNASGNGVQLYGNGTYNNPGRMSNTVVSGNGSRGVYSSEGWYRLFDCEINGNGSYGMYYSNVTYLDSLQNVSFSGNGTDGVGIASSNLESDRTWLSLVNGAYYVLGNIGIGGSNSSNCRLLTIGEGSVVKFASGTRMYVGCYLNSNGTVSTYYYGRLNAVGSAEDPVVFTSESGEPGGWNGLYFSYYCNANYPSLLKHCIVENGTRNLLTYNSMPVVEDCQIRNASGNGVELYRDGTYSNPGRMSNTVVSGNGNRGVYSSEGWYRLFDCEINGNGSYGMYYTNVNYLDSLQNVSFSGNGTDGVGIATSNLDSDKTWLGLVNGAYYVLGNIGIGGSNSSNCRLLTIGEGSVVKFATGTRMYVGCELKSDGSINRDYYYGRLNAVGSAEEPVAFTSESGEPGGWNGLFFSYNSHPSSLKHCIIENATTGVYMSNSSAATSIEDCIVRNSTWGMNLYYSSPTLKRCRFNGNTKGIYIQDNGSSQSNPTIGNDYVNGCDFFDNGEHVRHTGKANITMAYNYMGAIDSTFIEDHLIYDKADDANSGKLTFLPVSWLPMTFSEGFDWSGNLLYDGNASYPMTGNAIKVTDFHDALLYETTSGANGAFHIDDMQIDVANKVQIVTDLNINSNVNSTDALKVMNHFVHGTTLDERHLVVADVNKSKTVNGTDALLIQRRFVDLIDTFPLGDMSYTYDSVGHVDESSVYMKLNALCVGDVQVNNPNLREGVNLSYDGELLATSGQQLELPVRVTEDMVIGAISLRMLFPTEYLSVEQVLVAGEEALVSGQDGQLNISWYSLNPLYLEAGETLLTIKATAKDLSMLNEPVAFTLNSGSEFADANAFPYGSVTIAMPVVTTTALGVDEISEDSSVMLRAYPNPTDGRCVIDYELSDDCRVSMELYNMMGYRMLRMEDSYQTAGRHQVEFDGTGLSAGVYYCRLTCSDRQSEPKVIKIMIK